MPVPVCCRPHSWALSLWWRCAHVVHPPTPPPLRCAALVFLNSPLCSLPLPPLLPPPPPQGIATLALESPYYGERKPPRQQGAKLLHVADLLLLGRATIEESLLLLHWLGGQGHEQLGGCRRRRHRRC